MKNKLLHNMGLKILAVLVAIIVWMVGVTINDTLDDVPFYNMDVQMVNTHVLTSKEKTYTIMNNTDSVRVTVRAPKSVLSNITRDSISVKADFMELTDTDTVPITVSINEKNLEKYIESIETDKGDVLLNIEDKRSKQLRIEVVKHGKLPEGYVTGKVNTETNMMSISGPKSSVEKVVRAVAEVSMDAVTSNVEIVSQITLLDEDGEEVNRSDIKKSIDSVKVTIPILQTKEVPISYSILGTPEEGYALNGNTSASVNTIVIAGKESSIDDITEIVIPSSELNVGGAIESVETIVDIRKYLPADVSLGDPGFDGKITLIAEVEPIRRKNISFDAGVIQLLNKPDGFLVEALPGQQLKLSVVGLQQDLNEVDVAVVVPHCDLSEVLDEAGNAPVGEKEVTVKFLIPDDVRQLEQVTVRVMFTPIAGE